MHIQLTKGNLKKRETTVKHSLTKGDKVGYDTNSEVVYTRVTNKHIEANHVSSTYPVIFKLSYGSSAFMKIINKGRTTTMLGLLNGLKEKVQAVKEGFKLGYRESIVKQTINATNTKLGLDMQLYIGSGIGGAWYKVDENKVYIDSNIIGIMKEQRCDLDAITLLLKKHGVRKINQYTLITFLYLHEVGHSKTITTEKLIAEQGQRNMLLAEANKYSNYEDKENLLSLAMAYRLLPLEQEADLWAINTMKEYKLV